MEWKNIALTNYLGGTSLGGGLLYLAFMCKKGFLAESSAMVAASESRMLSSMAACVMAPATDTEMLLFIGLNSTALAKLMLRVFFAYPFSVPLGMNVFFASLTGVEARLWLRALCGILVVD